jgi:hypothetical protein
MGFCFLPNRHQLAAINPEPELPAAPFTSENITQRFTSAIPEITRETEKAGRPTNPRPQGPRANARSSAPARLFGRWVVNLSQPNVLQAGFAFPNIQTNGSSNNSSPVMSVL